MRPPWPTFRRPLPGEGGTDEAAPAGDLSTEGAARNLVLTDIIRRRRRPLLLVIDGDGGLLFSSVPEAAPAAEQRLLGQALAEARSLFLGHADAGDGESPTERAQPGLDVQRQRSVLALLGHEFYSVRVFALHGADDEGEDEQFAALVEPVVGPLAKDVDFQRVKQKFRLSNREGDVLEALMTGARDKEIARAVGLTTGTVRSYLKSIRAKLGVTTRTAIVNVVHGFGSEDSSTSH